MTAAILLPAAHGRAAAEGGFIRGLEAVTEPLPWFDDGLNYAAYDASIRELKPNTTVAVTSLGRPPMAAPLTLRLSRHVYPAGDGHVDALVRFDVADGEKPSGRLVVRWWDNGGQPVRAETIEPIPGAQLFFSALLPEDAAGTAGALSVTWERAGEAAAEAKASFVVGPPGQTGRSGRVRIDLRNDEGAVLPGVPFKVGIPFPRGSLQGVDGLRLVDESGRVIPAQFAETARWSRFGSVKWVHCVFVRDLQGAGEVLHVEWPGPGDAGAGDVTGPEPARAGIPAVDTGRVKIDAGGLWYDIAGDGRHRLMLEAKALVGGFVQRARGINYSDESHNHLLTEGRRYEMDPAGEFVVESRGPVETVVRTDGWYVRPGTEDKFCRYRVRYHLYRGSPLVRIVHTWIYTGDGNRETIRTMGWEFPLADGQADGILGAVGEDRAEWLPAYYLRQHEADEFVWFEKLQPPVSRRRNVWQGLTPERPIVEKGRGGRAPGLMRGRSGGGRVYVGVRDFWQNFPSSLRQDGHLMVFHQWPRYGRARQNPVHAGDKGNVWRLWFAHEGETLNFSLPPAITEDPIYRDEARSEPHFAYGDPTSVNAQGVAKTAEMWVYAEGSDPGALASPKALDLLARDRARAVVDPRWIDATGALPGLGAADAGRFPELEKAFDKAMKNVLGQVRRMGVYGKFIYGDLLREADLDARLGGLYRTFRKSHWGWPYSWRTYARSGDLDHFDFARAATRMMSDVAYTHHVSPEVESYFGEELAPRHLWTSQQPFRRQGWNNRNLIPWAGYWGQSSRMYVDKADYLWDAWYLTGDDRARDIALDWAAQTKVEEPDKLMRGPITAAENSARWPANLQKQYTEMYEATWDPWFLAAAQALADLHVWKFRQTGWTGHFWQAGYLVWQRFSGCPEHAEFVKAHVRHWTNPQMRGWADVPTTILASAAYGHEQTGDRFHLRRLAGVLDQLRWALYRDDQGGHYDGFLVHSGSSSDLLYKSWLQLWFPDAIRAFTAAGGLPDDKIHHPFVQRFGRDDRVLVRKSAGQPLVLRAPGKFSVSGPGGELVGEADGGEFVLEAGAAAGVYQVAIEGQAVLPLTAPDSPEIFVPAGGTVGAGTDSPQFWFQVPPDVASFWVEFENTRRPEQDVQQIVVWDPDGGEAWAFRQTKSDHDPAQSVIRAEIKVKPEHAGRLWRITRPGKKSPGFTLDPAIPPHFAHDPERWFQP